MIYISPSTHLYGLYSQSMLNGLVYHRHYMYLVTFNFIPKVLLIKDIYQGHSELFSRNNQCVHIVLAL